NWTFPAICAAFLKLATLLGLATPVAYLAFVRSIFSLLGAATALAAYWLARRFGAATLPAAGGAALFALAAPAIYFAPRALGETASALPVVLGLALAAPPRARRSALLVGTSLLGLAVLLRLQNGLFCAGLLAVL